MTRKSKNPLRVWMHVTWVGFAGLFASAVAFAASVRVTVAPVLQTLEASGVNDPQMLADALQHEFLGFFPLVTGLLTLVFLAMFVIGGLVFLFQAIRMIGNHPPPDPS